MKKEYLLGLKELLDRYDMSEQEKQDILADYSDMYDNWEERGMSDDEIVEKLGKPKGIIGSLVEGYRRIPKPSDGKEKIIALSPFVATIIFFIAGFGFNQWLYSWLAFILIPVTAIIVEMSRSKDPHVTTALSPFVTGVAYFIIGMEYQLWHPGWLIFLAIPLIAIFNSRDEMNFRTLLTAISPFVAVIAYVVLGDMGYWHNMWVVFLIIPFLGATLETGFKRVFLLLFLPVAVIAYLYLGDMYNEWLYTALVFTPLLVFYIINGNVQLWDKDAPKDYQILVAATVTTYVVVSLITQAWLITWLIFFAIPMYAINQETEQPEKTIAFTPFIATTIFILLGFFFGIWAWAWIAFLIIPVVAIIKSV